MITPQDAYNKGLDDAEAVIIAQLSSLIRDNTMADLQNPKLKVIQDVLSEWSEYFHHQAKLLTMQGKRHNKMLIKNRQHLDNNNL
jgi:hypothetical protein